MDKSRALEIINILASGADPLTGEVFPPEHAIQHPEIIRALYVAAIALSSEGSKTKAAKVRNSNLPEKAGTPWSDDEDRELLAAFDNGCSEKELAASHQRTPFAIRSRLIKLGRLEALKVPATAPSA